MKMWRTRQWSDEPEEVEVDRFTDKTVWLTRKTEWSGKPLREARVARFYQYHESHEAAISHIRGRMRSAVSRARSDIESAKRRLAKAEQALAAFNATHPEQPNA